MAARSPPTISHGWSAGSSMRRRRSLRSHGEPTEFELLTAVVFARFAEVRPDVALVEVGLGGRLDATHAWDGGVAVVTNVDLDHMDRLGRHDHEDRPGEGGHHRARRPRGDRRAR